MSPLLWCSFTSLILFIMRKHRRFEKVDNSTIITVQTPCMTPRLIMDMVAQDIEPEVKARKGLYGQGSESNPIPRTMSIGRFSRMATSRSVQTPSVIPESVVIESPAE